MEYMDGVAEQGSDILASSLSHKAPQQTPAVPLLQDVVGSDTDRAAEARDKEERDDDGSVKVKTISKKQVSGLC